MKLIAKVMVDRAVDREFDYRVPDSLVDTLRIGSRVRVPFGGSRAHGYVVGFRDRSDIGNLKAIESVVGDKPYLTDRLLELVRWVADYYCAPLEAAIRTSLPGAVRRKGTLFKARLFVKVAGEPPDADGLTPKQRAVLSLLNEAAESMPMTEVLRALSVTAAPVRALEKRGLVRIVSETVMRDPGAGRTILPTGPLALMPEQEAALQSVKASVDTLEPPVVLLHGVTGSGKTEVYLQAIRHVLDRGKGAIVLVPEISLTPQTVERFVSRFGSRVAVLHSYLSDGERHDEWHRVRDGGADIVIGARSAVFAPMPDLGLIVVDEEHEPSYKQEEAPRYNARDTAVMRGRIEGCAVLLGSATPSLESWYNAVRRRKYALAVLPHRADNRRMPVVRVIDMRIEAQRRGRVSVFSEDLLQAVQLRLERGEQTMLFLNRRGYSTSLICPQCGYVAKCDQCSVSFTYHRQTDDLRCHVCGDVRAAPACCPACRDPAFRFAGVGTQRVEAIVKKCFPQAVVERMDTDTTSGKNAHDRILGDFRAGRTHILVGTQMIAKGLHFPNVTLVGVICADLSLHMPDFRAGERTFQLLAQVAGRAGRGEVAGEVIVQTYTPMHEAIQAARRVDYDGFCDQESEFRRELRYPPFAHLVCIGLRGRNEERVKFTAAALARHLKDALPARVRLSAPCPAPLEKAMGKYRYQILMRCESVKAMTAPVRTVLKAVVLPKDVHVSVDVDALSLI